MFTVAAPRGRDVPNGRFLHSSDFHNLRSKIKLVAGLQGITGNTLWSSVCNRPTFYKFDAPDLIRFD